MSRKAMAVSSEPVEYLESRILLTKVHASQIATDYLDNRGQAFFTVSVALNSKTLTRKSASILTAGVDGLFGTADDARLYTAVGYEKGRLTLRADLPLNTPYRVRLNAAAILDINGRALDGEFNGDLRPSGDGVAGGSYDVVTKPGAKTRFRFRTVAGYINVGMFTKTAATTVKNFMSYANEGDWDTTFFHRSEHHTAQGGGLDVIQGGGFNVANGSIGSVVSKPPIDVQLGNSNVQGTIAMARGQATLSNTNQWFFNTQSNTVLDTTGGGYTVFGAVLDTESLNTLLAINNLQIRDATQGNTSSPFGELPVVDPAAGNTRQIAVPGDLVMVTRVAQLYDLAVTPNTSAKPAAISTPAAVVNPTAPVAAAIPFLAIKDQKDSLLD